VAISAYQLIARRKRCHNYFEYHKIKCFLICMGIDTFLEVRYLNNEYKYSQVKLSNVQGVCVLSKLMTMSRMDFAGIK